jgi:tyrocidine synthetase-3
MKNNRIVGDVVTSAAAAQNIKERDYWLNCLSGELIKTTFPCAASKKEPHAPGSLEFINFRFTGEMYSQLIKLSKGIDYTLHMILVAGMTLLLYRYTGSRDIIIGTPIYKQEITGKFINTILALRNKIQPQMTVKELLLQIRQTIIEATENQNYPIETLLYKLDIQTTAGQFPLFDIALLLDNIHDKEYMQNIKLNMIFSFRREENEVQGVMEYNSSLYERTAAQGIIRHYMNLMQEFLFNLDMEVRHLEILSGDERKQVLYDFNDTRREYPTGKTIVGLFEEQAARQPAEPALILAGRHLTYGELSRTSTRLAAALRSRGVKKESIVALMVERSIEMIKGMLGILKAGGAYLPIDCQCPQERLKYMLNDSEINLLLTQKHLGNRLKVDVNLQDLEDETLYTPGPAQEDSYAVTPAHLAYVIYTSGSTGKAKGVAVEHCSIVNTLQWRKDYYGFNQKDAILQVLGYTFDSSVEDIFTTLIAGARLVLVPQTNVYDLQYLAKIIKETGVTYFLIVPGFYKSFLAEISGSLSKVRAVTVAGDSITEKLVETHFRLLPGVKLYNEYGPTENSVCTTAYQFAPRRTKVLIGKPIANVRCYILDPELRPCPIGVPGELCAAGKGLSRGYLKRPGLTKEKFIDNPYEPGEKMFRTGDMARWLPDGNIDFLGRMDYQVKIRGFRIELGEIENQLIKLEEIKEAVVIAREDARETPGVISTGDKFLCAYLVSEKKLDFTRIKDRLAGNLPEYMIPPYLMQIEKIPLTPNGKIDRKALPRPKMGSTAGRYAAPRDKVEERLVDIWSDLLKIEKDQLGIDANFFENGGHSLLATVLVSKISKEFNVKVLMVTIFEKVTIRELAQCIKAARRESFTSIEPVEKKEYYPLSSTQKSLYFLQQMKENNTAYHMYSILPLEKNIDAERLESALKKIITRHENLRTSFEVISGQPVQKIHNRVEFSLGHYETDDTGIGGLPGQLGRPFDLSRPPLLRATLVKPRSNHSQRVLFLEVHHIISDETSQALLQKEFSQLYRGELLPPLRLHYKDYSQWQGSGAHRGTVNKQGNYWMKEFTGTGQAGAEGGRPPVLELHTDYPRPPFQGFEGNTVIFDLTKKETAVLRKIAREENATVFMVLLTVTYVLLSKLSGQEDIVVGTPGAGRNHAHLENVIGMFINTLAIRHYPRAHKTLTGFFKEVKAKTLEAFENQEYPFEELVEKLAIERDPGRNPLFDVMLNLVNEEEYPGANPGENIQEPEVGTDTPTYSHIKGACRFDLTFLVTDTPRRIFVQFIYSTALYKPETAERIIGYFRKILAQIESNWDRPISHLEIIPVREKHRLLYEFNETGSEYPKDATIIQLYQNQVRQTPDIPAVIFEDNCLTYSKLEEQTNRLGRLLRSKGVRADSLVSLVVERSLEMVVGMLGIMKAGGAYVPISPAVPAARLEFMLDNANVTVLLTQDQYTDRFNQEYEIINLNSPTAYSQSAAPLENINTPKDLAYIIYTSGSTGQPKGVMIEIRSVINIVTWFAGMYHLGPGFNLVQMFEYTFDASINQVFGSLLHGVTLHIIRKEHFYDIEFLREYIDSRGINLINFVQSVIRELVCEGDRPKSLKYLVSGAEKLRKTVKDEILDTGYALYNQYGPTEATVDAAAEKCTYDHDGTIGKPVSNAQCYILNRYNQLTPIGAAGELCVGGDGLARGYVNNPALTAEKFTEIEVKVEEEEGPQEQIPNKNMSYMSYKSYIYKTGDLARWLSDGNIQFLGRIDHQVKIRGFRIELGEIESQLLKIPGIKEAVVLHREGLASESYLCAYIVPQDEMVVELDRKKLKRDLSGSLPDYMIPTYFVQLDNLPLNTHGKLERELLPEPGITPDQAYEAPGNPIEQKLVDIWAEILKIGKEKIGIHADFFDLGGHSLTSTIMVSRIHKELNIKIPLAEVFRTPTVRELAELIRTLKQDKFTSIKPVEKKEYYVLSSAQARLYVLQRMKPDGTVYNMPYVLPLGGSIDEEKLEHTFKILISRHESLRTCFELVEEEPVQKVCAGVEFEIEYYDMKEVNALASPANGSQELRVKRFIDDFIRPFDLSRAPLLRVGLMEIAAKEYILLCDMHHIVTDGASHAVLTGDFTAIYTGEELLPLRLQYKDYSEWQQSQASEEETAQQEQYWLRRFQGEIPVLDIPGDYPRPQLRSFEGRTVVFDLSTGKTKALNEWARYEGATLFMVLLAIYTLFLSKISNQGEILVGTPVAGRKHADIENIIGMFVNTLVLRSYPAGDKTLSGYLQEVKRISLEAFENQDYPFEELVKKVAVTRDVSRNPLFDIAFVLQNTRDIPGSQEPPRATRQQNPKEEQEQVSFSPEYNTAKFDLTLFAFEEEKEEKLVFIFQYCTQLFRKTTIEKFIAYFKKITAAAIETPGMKIAEIEIISTEEKKRLLFDFNAADAGYPKKKTIHGLFAEQVKRTPHRTALMEVHETHKKHEKEYNMSYLSYKELNEKSGRLAHLLRQQGIVPGTIVGIKLERSIEVIIGILAILKAGGAYMPIDPDYPQERIKYMLKDSNAKILLTKQEMAELFSSIHPAALLPCCPAQSSNLAYIIYTSGTTGKPKGVLIEHRNVVSLLFNDGIQFYFNENDVWTLFHSICFDFSVWEMYGALLYGGKLITISKETARDTAGFLKILQAAQVTVLNQTPSAFYSLCREDLKKPGKELNIKYVIFGGEALMPGKLNQWKAKYPQTKLINMFGITETTVHVTFKEINQADIEAGISNIGRPIPTLSVYIMDANLKPQPAGTPGECCIGGEGLGRGYLNRPRLTKEKFVMDPYRPGKRLYRSGDLLRQRDTGEMEYLGRIDQQVKIRGYRIELEEIETRLLQYNGIKEVVVMDRVDETGDKFLCAYIVLNCPTDREEWDSKPYRQYLTKTLPAYMVPAYFVTLPRIPLTPSGKVDRKALPVPGTQLSKQYAAPGNETEKKLVEIWSEVLGIEKEKIGINDNFFEIGGHSLKATMLMTKIHRWFDVNVSMAEIFKTPFISEIASIIEATRWVEAGETKIDVKKKREEIIL